MGRYCMCKQVNEKFIRDLIVLCEAETKENCYVGTAITLLIEVVQQLYFNGGYQSKEEFIKDIEENCLRLKDMASKLWDKNNGSDDK